MNPTSQPPKKSIRTYEPSRPPGYRKSNWDEQLWPVNAGLILLAGAAAAFIFTIGDFATRDWWRNGWIHLGLLSVIMAVLAWGMARLDGRVHRRLQMGVLFSLLLHLGLCMLTYHVHMSIVARRQAEAETAVDEPQIITMPDYHWQQELDEVIEDESIVAPTESEPVTSQELEPDRSTAEGVPADRPAEMAATVDPSAPSQVELERAEMSAPRRADSLAGERISRQETEHSQPVEALDVPAVQRASERVQQLDDRVELEPLAADVAAQRPDASEPEPADRPAAAPIERAAIDRQPEPSVAATERASRQIEAADAPSTRVDRLPAAPPTMADPQQQAEPSQANLARRDSQAPERAGQAEDFPAQAGSLDAGAFEPRRADNSFETADVPQRSQSRPARAASRAPGTSAPIEVDSPPAPASAELTAAQPAATQVLRSERSAATVSRPAGADPQVAGDPGESVAIAARRAQASRQDDADDADSPSRPANVPRARAGADIPSVALEAQEVTVPDAAGGPRPARIEASSSAAVERRSSRSPSGRITAAAGEGPIDRQAPRAAVTPGGRPVATAQPALSGAARSPRLARSGIDATQGTDATALPAAPAERSPTDRPGPTAPGDSDPGDSDPGDSDPGDSDPGPAGPAVAGIERPRTGELALTRPSSGSAAGGSQPGTSDRPRGGVAGIASGPRRPESSPSQPAGVGRASTPRRTPGLADGIEQPLEVAGAPGEPASAAPAAGSQTAGPDGPSSGSDRLQRQRPAGLPVRIAAPSGPGGLAEDRAGPLGVPGRRARPESPLVHAGLGRLILKRSGSTTAADVRVQDAAVPGLKQRDREMREQLARQSGGSATSERAVELGLEFLARHQSADGSWSLEGFARPGPGYQAAGPGRMQSDTAATGLALLAFLGAGYTHTDGKYRDVVARGVEYLLTHQRENGDLFVPMDEQSNKNVWLYSHGIAAIALCEAYGMTRDPLLAEPAQKCLDFIVWAQSPEEGGWRYYPRRGSDTSVSGWQLMALKSGELAGLSVPRDCYQRVDAWLDGAQGQANRALYVYRPRSEQPHQRQPSRVMTAEALLMRQYLGWKRDNPYMLAGADYLRANLPQWEGGGRNRDAYYWYYATQVMFQMGGEHWTAWNNQLRPLLTERQETEGPLAGSWDPAGGSADRWGREGGRIYVTAMHLLILEVYYRHLPLYRNLQEETAEAG